MLSSSPRLFSDTMEPLSRTTPLYEKVAGRCPAHEGFLARVAKASLSHGTLPNGDDNGAATASSRQSNDPGDNGGW